MVGPDEKSDPGTAPRVSATSRTLEAIFRAESPRLIATVARIVRDVGVAEELVQDAILSALEQWPASGIPDNPGAWLMVAAKNRAINRVKHASMARRKQEQLAHWATQGLQEQVPEPDAALEGDIGDDLLRLVFIACHPVLPVEARVALTLRAVGGLTTEEIARAFLVSEATMAQRLVRAKRTLSEQRIPFELPAADELVPRLGAVLGVVYLIFNEGYSSMSAEDVVRKDLCDDALRIGRVLAELVPSEPEVHGLVALMELHASRAAARVGPSGEPVLLLDQDRSLWDPLLVSRGLAALERAERLGGRRGPYAIQAAIGACHARATTAASTDWAAIAALYAELGGVAPSPVVELNRAMAVSMAEGPAAGLAIVDALLHEPALQHYHFLPSARADLLFRLRRFGEAQAEFERAAELAPSPRDRRALRERAAACAVALERGAT
jgi:RNA polymerase sigma factor (sigma-70 family)